MAEQSDDLRFGTVNTKLATALLVLGFKLVQQPFSTVLNMRRVKEGKFNTTIWLEPFIKTKADGSLWMGRDKNGAIVEKPLLASRVEEIWVTPGRDAFLPQVHWMRGALLARDTILKTIVYGSERRNGIPQSEWFRTDNVKVSAVLQFNGFPVLLYNDRWLYHAAESEALSRSLQRADGDVPERWGMTACKQQEILISAIRGPGNLRQQIVTGSKGREAHIPEIMSDELKRIHYHEITK